MGTTEEIVPDFIKLEALSRKKEKSRTASAIWSRMISHELEAEQKRQDQDVQISMALAQEEYQNKKKKKEKTYAEKMKAYEEYKKAWWKEKMKEEKMKEAKMANRNCCT